MSAENIRPVRPIRRIRRSAGERLRSTLQTMAGDKAQFTAHRESGWASITFAGTRHSLDLIFEGEEGVEAGEQFIAALPDHEFAIPGQLVADATVLSVNHTMLPTPQLSVTVELLLLEDA